MTQAFLLLSLLALTHAIPCHLLDGYAFDDYANEFSKTYASTIEYNFRKQLFETKLESIRAHNADSTKTWKQGVNQFTDRTTNEFEQLLGLKKSLLYTQKMSMTPRVEDSYIAQADLPTNVDWREKGVISAVKDQGNCGSCWTFATVEETESAYALATGKLHVLSEQQILDCTPNPQHCGGTGGCDGGTAELAWAKIIQMGGLDSEWIYPYQSYFGSAFVCRYGQAKPAVTVSSFVNLPPNEQDPILNYLGMSGPLAISVDASTWSTYESGVFDGCNQTAPDIDHAVQLVGYGTDSSLGDYWLVRNSWSPVWGENGYIRLKRTTEIQCGTDSTPSDGDGCSGGPPTVKVCGTCGVLFDGVYPVVKH